MLVFVITLPPSVYSSITAKDFTLLYEDNPGTRAFIKKIRNENIKYHKALAFNVGLDKDNAEIGFTDVETNALALEDGGFDTFSIVVYELKNGKKIAGITVMGYKGDYEKFIIYETPP